MAKLEKAVAKTMSVVFSDVDLRGDEKKRRIASLKANIGKVANISIDEITTNENVRKSIDMNSESFLRLVESVKRYGILENIVAELRVNKSGSDYKLVCIAGHRRILAAKKAKNISKVPCLLQLYKEQSDRVGAALAENLNREDLHCLDVADGYRALVESGWNENQLSEHFCRDIRTVRHYLKMARWTAEIKKLLRSKPEVFSTRVIMRQFAYKKFNNSNELKLSIKNYLEPVKKIGKASKSSTKKSNEKVSVQGRQVTRTALKKYLSKQKYLSKLVKDEIEKAFVELKII